MNQNDQSKALVVLGLIVLAGLAFLGYQLLIGPYLEYGTQIERAEKAIRDKETVVGQIVRDRAKLKQWRLLSLPGAASLSQGTAGARTPADAAKLTGEKYATHLYGLLKKHGVASDFPVPNPGDPKAAPQLPGNIPAYTPIQVPIHVKETKLKNLVGFLLEFQATPLLHRVSHLTVKHAEGSKAAGLTVFMTVEALVLHGAAPRGPELVAAAKGQIQPDVLPAALPKRDYSAIPKKNVFEGKLPDPPPIKKYETVPGKPKPKPQLPPRQTPDLVTFAYLTDVTIPTNPGAPKATHFDRSTEQTIELQTALGSNWIPLVKDGEGYTVVRGRVLTLTTSGAVFRVELKTSPPEASAKSRYKSKYTIYELPEDEVYELTKTKPLLSRGKWTVYKMQRVYWDGLVRDKVVQETPDRRTGQTSFHFKWGLIKGQVISSKGAEYVVIALPERYCSFWDENDDDDEGVTAHPGYCSLTVGFGMMDALRAPLSSEAVRLIRAATEPAPRRGAFFGLLPPGQTQSREPISVKGE
jgi:hypothetical protein